MLFTKEGIYDYISENDVKFIRLAFTDVFGNAKNISILASQLKRALDYGISIDASAIKGFGSEEKSDLFLKPDLDTISLLPWRPSSGRVARFYCNVVYPNGKPFELDGRTILSNAMKKLQEKGIKANFSSECEFYLFKKDEYDNPTLIPLDKASYLDIAPDDRGENVRREIALTLENMHIVPESSHHEEGPGQNEIDFKYSNPLDAADNAITVKTVIKTIADNYGLYASFDPKPLKNQAGNGFHINMSVTSDDKEDYMMYFMAGILKHIKEITLFLNSNYKSYERLGSFKAPKYITWSSENRSQLIRIPAYICQSERRIELRSPDPLCNPYLAYALLLYAGLDGIENKLICDEPVNVNLYNANNDILDKLDKLPSTINEAFMYASSSEFIKKYIPKRILDTYKNELC